jgi:type I restriction enzyme M protein
LSYPDYVEQLTYLLFLKMADEQTDGPVPPQYSWQSFAGLDATAMHRRYDAALGALSQMDGMLGLIFKDAKNKIRDPSKLRLLVGDLIGQTEWSGLSSDLKGDAYEGLLEKNARDTKSGAGQYFTPRPLIDAIVKCVDPKPGEVVCDPACGTAGFLLSAHSHIKDTSVGLSPSEARHLKTRAIRGVELVQEVARLAAMNLMLHGVGGQTNDELPVVCADSLDQPPRKTVDVVLTNPPFGVKGSVTYSSDEAKIYRQSEDLQVSRPDFWVRTANKQLNFVQHVVSLLKPGGRAAVVLPDNVLYDGGPAVSIRRKLLQDFNVHTLLRLPTGLFYAQGVKANVLFFDKPKKAAGRSQHLWVYDLRSDNRFSLKTRPIKADDLVEFVDSYGGRDRKRDLACQNERWQAVPLDSLLMSPDVSFDIKWQSNVLPIAGKGTDRLDRIASLIEDDLERALAHIRNASRRE